MLPNKEKLIVVLFVFFGCSSTSFLPESEDSCDDSDDANVSYESSDVQQNHVITFDNNGIADERTLTVTSIKFYFYAPSDTLELNSTNRQLVNMSQPTKIIIHGVGGFQKQGWIDQMVKIYHTQGDYNIIAVDWSAFSTDETLYVVSVIDSLGQYIGDFIMDVTVDNYDYLTEVHLIGSNIGAQIAGAIGESIAQKNKGKVGRITGLDPTKPENLEILDKADADFVDAIHTTVAYGKTNVGTVDFYVTTEQPDVPVCANDSCGETLVEDYFMSTITDQDRFEGVSCYNASAFVKKLCDKAHSVAMGEHVPRNISGNYLVQDSASGKFSREKYVMFVTALLVLSQFVV